MSDPRPRLYSCHFGGDPWDSMARVLAWSASTYCCPIWSITIERLEPDPMVSSRAPSEVANTLKLDRWAQVVEEAPDGAEILLLDTDTMILRPLSDLWAMEFDLAFTMRPPGSRMPFNAGVVAVRVSPAMRAFFMAWRDENRRMLADTRYHQPWARRFGGLNQSALGKLLHEGPQGLAIRKLTCLEWNCEDTCWQRFDPKLTRIVHVKSALRRACIAGGVVVPWLRPLADTWRDLLRQAGGAPPEMAPPPPLVAVKRGASVHRARTAGG